MKITFIIIICLLLSCFTCEQTFTKIKGGCQKKTEEYCRKNSVKTSLILFNNPRRTGNNFMDCCSFYMKNCIRFNTSYDILARKTDAYQCTNHTEYEEFCYDGVCYDVAYETRICQVVWKNSWLKSWTLNNDFFFRKRCHKFVFNVVQVLLLLFFGAEIIFIVKFITLF